MCREERQAPACGERPNTYPLVSFTRTRFNTTHTSLSQPVSPQYTLANTQTLFHLSRRVDVDAYESAVNQHHGDSVALLTPTHPTGINAVVRLAPIKFIPQKPAYVSDSGQIVQCIWLPEYAEAKILVADYSKQLGYIQHVVCKPLLLPTVEALYRQIENRESIDSGRHVLLVSIIASVTHIWIQRVDSRIETPLFSSSAQARVQTPFWINAAYRLLLAKRDDTTPTLEKVQGIIILSFVIANLEGVCMRIRLLISTAISLSREIKLDQIDQGPKLPLPMQYKSRQVVASGGI
jgi:hypothetical protein